MPLRETAIDELLANVGPKLFGDPLRESTRVRQQQLLIASLASIGLGLGLLEFKDASAAGITFGIPNSAVLMIVLLIVVFYLALSYGLAMWSDARVFHYSVIPHRRELVSKLATLHMDNDELRAELVDLVRRRFDNPWISHDEQVEVSKQNLRNLGLEGADFDSMLANIAGQARHLVDLSNSSTRLANLRRTVDTTFTFITSAIAVLILALRLQLALQ